ncbi:hypothetical protein E2320_013108 [Naja naja]|nr:hypothetical protein E2320_013108 [Naja naja]
MEQCFCLLFPGPFSCGIITFPEDLIPRLSPDQSHINDTKSHQVKSSIAQVVLPRRIPTQDRGEYDTSAFEHSEQLRQILRVYQHPSYNKTSKYENDLALLELSAPLVLNKYVTPICIGNKVLTEYLLENGRGSVSGWWKLNYLKKISNTLQRADIEYVDQGNCLQNNETQPFPNTFCAGHPTLVRKVYEGNSGAPVVTERNNTWFLTGIMTCGTECTRDKPYYIFTSEEASTVLHRYKRFNSGRLEEVLQGSLERECMEEVCNFEEAREIFENDEKTMRFWTVYLDGDQCEPNPCKNGGRCEDGTDDYTCWCPGGYDGKSCELAPEAKVKHTRSRPSNSFDNWISSSNATEDWEEDYNHTQVSFHLSKRIRVVGGMESKKGEVPWQVYLLNSEGNGFCGGTIINEKWIVTAAHCLEFRPQRIVAGEHNIYTVDNTEQYRNVVRAIPHPTYNTTNKYHNDIALLELDAPLEFNHYVTPICIADKEFTNSLLKFGLGTVSGWGKLAYQGRQASILQVLQIRFIDRPTCLRSSSYPILANMFCAGHPDGAKDTCQGDSGGPYTTDIEHVWFLTGITSWGEECAKKDKYGIYTRVSRYIKWIRETTKRT